MPNKIFDTLQSFDRNERLIPYGILLLRITLAVLWLVHGLFKAVHDGMPATERSFVELGYPAWAAWADVLIECGAFVVLLLGAYVRIVSVLLLVLLIPATLVWIPKGYFFNNGGYEFPLVWCFLQVVLALLGPGALNIAVLRRVEQPLFEPDIAV